MKKEALQWLKKEHAFFVECHPGSEPLVWFLESFFMESATEFSYLLEQASLGYGVAAFDSINYMLENDIYEDGQAEWHGKVEFNFNYELDGIVDIPTYITVLELVSSAYVKIYPEERENILALLEKVKSRYKAAL